MPMQPFLTLPERPSRPRTSGLTHVLDAGLAAHQAAALCESASSYIDVVKLGWGTAYVSQDLDAKLDSYRAAGLAVVCGGTLFEAAVLHDRLDAYCDELDRLGITWIEISDGTIPLERSHKLAAIERLSERFSVLSEVGSKFDDRQVPSAQWGAWAREELNAGAWKVIAEARQSGSVGVFRADGSVREDIVDSLLGAVSLDDIVFEAPSAAQQAWFIATYGPHVNLGNIAPGDVIGLETLRLGLRSDTLEVARSWAQPAG